MKRKGATTGIYEAKAENIPVLCDGGLVWPVSYVRGGQNEVSENEDIVPPHRFASLSPGLITEATHPFDL
jgi:hypothetical protein